MIPAAAVAAQFLAQKVLDVLADRVSSSILAKLRTDPARRAFEKALEAALERYNAERGELLAAPLLAPNGVLDDEGVSIEFAHVVQFRRTPDPAVIARRWRAGLDEVPSDVDLDAEAVLLLSFFRSELRQSDLYRPVFDSKSLDALVTEFRVLSAQLSQAPRSISELSIDFTSLIEDRTRGFVGRRFIFDAIDEFVQSNRRGYFVIRGDPGVGKTALAAELTKRRGLVHHFNIRAEGISTAGAFLRSVCAQLIAVHGLDEPTLPPQATKDAAYLRGILEQVADESADSDKILVVVDALDEAQRESGTNPLLLPTTLPEGIFFVLTMRPPSFGERETELHIECEQQVFDLKQDMDANREDVRRYLGAVADAPGFRASRTALGLSRDELVEKLLAKSEGNFMYLRYVVPEIESGAYRDLDLDLLPVGLENYYEDHWRRMRARDDEGWFRFRLPVLAALTVVRRPISVDLIGRLSGVSERARIKAVLAEWAPFLVEERVEHEGTVQPRYRLYHASFHDFVAKKDELDGEIDLETAKRNIRDAYWADLFGDSNAG